MGGTPKTNYTEQDACVPEDCSVGNESFESGTCQRLETQASVAKGATSLYVANVVVLLANTLYFLILTNILRSTLDVGIVTALNLMILLLAAVCLFAQPITSQSPIPAPLAVLKFIPELLAKREGTQAARVFKSSFGASGILAAMIGAVLVVSPNLAIPIVGGQPDFVRLAAVDVIAYSLCQVCFGTLIAVGDLRNATTYIVSWAIARYAMASILLVPYTIFGVLVGWIIGDSAILLVAFRVSVRRIQKSSGSGSFSSIDLWRYSIYTLFSAVIGYGVTQADKIFTLASQGLSELAIYNVAIVAATFTGFAPYALLTVLLPALAALHSRGRREEMHEMIRSYTRYVSIIVLPIAIGFASVAEIALRIFGPAYISGLVPTVIVSVATGLTAIGAVYASALLALGELRWYTAANLLGLGALFAISAMLTGVLGLAGPALGRAALMAIAAVVYAVALRRSGFLELDTRAFLSATGSSALMGVVVFGALASAHSFLLKLTYLPALIILGAAIYLGCLRLLRLLTATDLEFVRGMAPTRFHPLINRIGRYLVVEFDK
jgi:O-antigen/teichoic acid export membrane protein